MAQWHARQREERGVKTGVEALRANRIAAVLAYPHSAHTFKQTSAGCVDLDFR